MLWQLVRRAWRRSRSSSGSVWRVCWWLQPTWRRTPTPAWPASRGGCSCSKHTWRPSDAGTNHFLQHSCKQWPYRNRNTPQQHVVSCPLQVCVSPAAVADRGDGNQQPPEGSERQTVSSTQDRLSARRPSWQGDSFTFDTTNHQLPLRNSYWAQLQLTCSSDTKTLCWRTRSSLIIQLVKPGIWSDSELESVFKYSAVCVSADDHRDVPQRPGSRPASWGDPLVREPAEGADEPAGSAAGVWPERPAGGRLPRSAPTDPPLAIV